MCVAREISAFDDNPERRGGRLVTAARFSEDWPQVTYGAGTQHRDV